MENKKTTKTPKPVAGLAKLTPRAVVDLEKGTVLAAVDVTASAEQVFKALTTDEQEIWWGAPEVYINRNWKADIRVGGKWEIETILPDGNVFPAGGEFLEIDKPNKITLTRRYDFDYPVLGRRVTTVTYLLAPVAAGTRVTIRHEGFDGLVQEAYDHAAGWERFLGWLDDYLSKKALKR